MISALRVVFFAVMLDEYFPDVSRGELDMSASERMKNKTLVVIWFGSGTSTQPTNRPTNQATQFAIVWYEWKI